MLGWQSDGVTEPYVHPIIQGEKEGCRENGKRKRGRDTGKEVKRERGKHGERERVREITGAKYISGINPEGRLMTFEEVNAPWGSDVMDVMARMSSDVLWGANPVQRLPWRTHFPQ